MFAEPTIDDFLDRVRRRLAETTADLNRAIGAIVSDHASRGILVSSATVQRVWEESLKIHTTGVQHAFEDLTHAIATMKIDPHVLRQTAVDELGVYNAKIKSIAEGKTQLTPAMKQFNTQESQKIAANFDYLLRQFDVGMTPAEGVPATVMRAMASSGNERGNGKTVAFERRHDVLIKARRASVFDYVTNPKRWPEWMPTALKVGFEDRPAKLGDLFQQQWSTSKGPVDLDWLVIACNRPGLWIGLTGTSFTGPIVVQYDFDETPDGTVLTRIIRHPRRPRALSAETVDRIDAQAEQALEKIKEMVERH
jgi:hypothetical protein